MKFGLFYHVQWPETKTQEQVFAELIEQVQYAEELGFYSLWMAEHHFTRYGVAPSPLTVATYLAAKTSKIRLGTAIAVLPYHNPILLAEQVALLDVLSNGRVDLGVGRGIARSTEYVDMKIPAEESEGRFTEMLDILPGLWTTPRFSYEGAHYQLDDITLAPRPVQQPHPPVYVGVTSTESRIQEAVERGWQICSGVVIDHNDHLNIRRTYNRMAAEKGSELDSSGSPVFYHTYVAETPEEAREGPKEGLWWMYLMVDFLGTITKGSDLDADFLAFVKEHPDPSFVALPDQYATPSKTYDFVCKNRAFFGTPEEVTSSIKGLQAHGVEYYVCDFAFGGNEHSKVMRTMELFAKEVMPHFS